MFPSTITCILFVVLAACTTVNAAAVDRVLASRQVKPELVRKGYYAARRLTAASRILYHHLGTQTYLCYSGQAVLL